jgi:hypothetical protein
LSRSSRRGSIRVGGVIYSWFIVLQSASCRLISYNKAEEHLCKVKDSGSSPDH